MAEIHLAAALALLFALLTLLRVAAAYASDSFPAIVTGLGLAGLLAYAAGVFG